MSDMTVSREDRLREIEDRGWGYADDVPFLLAELACVTEEARTMREALRKVGPLVLTSACLKRPPLKTEPWDGPCGKCAPCLAAVGYSAVEGVA